MFLDANPVRVTRAMVDKWTATLPFVSTFFNRVGQVVGLPENARRLLSMEELLLIFPEGTSSPDGVMREFKPSIGYLALLNQVDVVPMYLEGTYDALPRGAVLPVQRRIAAHIAPLVRAADLKAATAGMGRSEQYREAARIVENAVRGAKERR